MKGMTSVYGIMEGCDNGVDVREVEFPDNTDEVECMTDAWVEVARLDSFLESNVRHLS